MLKPPHPMKTSHFGKPKEPHIESLDNISEKESALMRNHSIVSISSQNKTKELIDTSEDSKEARKKPALHVFTHKTEEIQQFFNKVNDKRSKKKIRIFQVFFTFFPRRFHPVLRGFGQ